MSFETAIRLTEVLLALAMIQQSLEHMVSYRAERLIFAPRLALCLLLLLGVQTALVTWALMALALVILHRFQGPYNGGSSKMTVLILTCLSAVHLAPSPRWAELALGYLAVQLVLSYFVSGWIKVINPVWRNGEALADVFRFSAYPVSEGLRAWADRPRTLFVAGWAVMLLELAFPLALLHPLTLVGALVLTASFHFSNACFFGLNRFFWIWLAAYPSLLWFQGRVIG